MVSIRKAKQGFSLRNPRQSQSEKEKIGLLVAGLCIGVLFIVFTSTTGGSNIDTVPQGMANQPLRYRKPHPELDLDEEDNKRSVKKPNDAINALALDVLETLECEKLFDELNKPDKRHEASSDNKSPDSGDRAEHRRRRLDENRQHGDDGGFQNIPDNANNAGDTGADKAKDDDANKEGEEEVKWGREAMGNADMMKGMMDDYPAGYSKEDDRYDQFLGYSTLTAQHLLCLAAMPDPPPEIVSRFSCAATSGPKRRSLLDFWSAARSHISDANLLKKVLNLAQEKKSQLILEKTYNLWAPLGDSGVTYMVNTINNELQDTLKSLEQSLGDGKLFVDVGSGMGLTTMAIAQQYPETRILSIEPAFPNWILQQLNLRCNLDKPTLSKIKVVMVGVGPNSDDEDDMMAKLMWRPTSTTSTRAWTPAEEFGSQDIELLVRLRRLRSILAEADVYINNKGSTPNMMDLLNLDCQGCEYNLIPALSDEEFDAIPNIMGYVHWGYIPLSKLPSSERGKQTHGRLCQHETIAKNTRECCAFLNTPVKSSVPGEVLYRDKNRPEVVTVSDIIPDDMCKDFDTWSEEHYMNAIKDDWGWFELSSQAH